MTRCPLTYRRLPDGISYHPDGLQRLHPALRSLAPLPFTAEELRHEAAARSDKMSVGGVQPKMSAVLDVDEATGEGAFRLVDTDGRYLLKPPTHHPEIPANEDLTMRLAALASVETPWHGLLRTADGDLCYAIRRFDRLDDGAKLGLEDAGQLLGYDRDTKYDASMEALARGLLEHVTLPRSEAVALFRLVLVNYLVGNEDAHLRNFSVLTRPEGRVVLAPAYDVLNSTIALRAPQDELALTLAGKKSRFQRSHFDAYATHRLGLPATTVARVARGIASSQPLWDEWIGRSLLSAGMQERYRAVLAARRAVLFG